MGVFFLGLAVGGLEYLLLHQLVKAAGAGNAAMTLLLLMCKFIVLAAVFVPVVLLNRADVAWCGAGVAAGLIVCAFAFFVKGAMSKKKEMAGDNQNERD